jgi:quercetin dioxygenase-like cupin family protein
MSRHVLLSLAIALSSSLASSAQAAHTMVTPADLKWGAAPPVLPAGAQVAVLDGDPFKPGSFTIRLKMPDGYMVAPHWHPTDENIVVIQGTFKLGMGDKSAAAAARDLPAGSFAKMPKEMHHFAMAKGETIVQIYGPGPFVVNYLNPTDDPSRKK